ncbi:hypothetical protein BB561_006452 [Smittium simulii]|uniref:Ty3 transposon capsid-like protein domain-containing protein n=1 Tax=Smittium simulii TaxID=133385 RepID=A0A2T9Y480_9FUNG|nr:hypothetical protein BB561_006452 [Smittium simulii]
MNIKFKEFNGDNGTDVKIWARKFKQGVAIKKWTDQEAIEVFKYCMAERAMSWLMDIKEQPEGKDANSLEDWINLLKRDFKAKRPAKKKDLNELEHLNPKKFDSVHSFNIEFIRNLSIIDQNYYTDHMIKKTYLQNMYSVSPEVTEELLGERN